MTRAGRAALAASAALAAAVALAQTSRPAQVTFTVAVWEPLGGRPRRALSHLIRTFTRAHPDVMPVVMRFPASEARRRLLRWMAADSKWRPEVVVARDEWLSELWRGVEPLPEKAAAAVRKLAPSELSRRISEGEAIAGAPFWLHTRVLFFWPDLLSKPTDWQPESWKELFEAARQAAREGKWGFGLPGHGPGAEWLPLAIVWASGTRVCQFGQVDLMCGAAERALDLLFELANGGGAQPQALTWTQAELEDKFVDRQLCAIVAPPELADRLAVWEGEKKWAVAPLPAEEPFTPASLDVLCVLGGSKRRREALEFVSHAASPAGQACIAEAGGLPAYSAVARECKRPEVRAAAAGLKNPRFLPRDDADALRAALELALYLRLSGRAASAYALEQAQAEFARLAGHSD